MPGLGDVSRPVEWPILSSRCLLISALMISVLWSGSSIHPLVEGKAVFHFYASANKMFTGTSDHCWSNIHTLQQSFGGLSEKSSEVCESWTEPCNIAQTGGTMHIAWHWPLKIQLCEAPSDLDGEGEWQSDLYRVFDLNLSRCLRENRWIALWRCCCFYRGGG